MKTVRIPDRDIVNAEFPAGFVSWTPEASAQWLKDHGVTAPYKQWFDKNTSEHVYEMPEPE